jgi:hypothetical protein
MVLQSSVPQHPFPKKKNSCACQDTHRQIDAEEASLATEVAAKLSVLLVVASEAPLRSRSAIVVVMP